MFNFLFGLAIGWIVGSWYTTRGLYDRGALEQFRDRATGALTESARIVEQSRRELREATRGNGGRNAGRGSGA